MCAQEANLQNIRGRITHFVNARQKAYEISVKKGRTIPGYAEKISAILMLKVHLQASEHWDLQANLRWIHQLRQQILVLLPSEFNEDPRQRKYRQHMLDLLSYCELLLDSKPMFHRNPKAA